MISPRAPPPTDTTVKNPRARSQATGQARDDVDAADLVQLVAGMCLARDADEQQSLRLLSVVLDGIRTGRS